MPNMPFCDSFKRIVSYINPDFLALLAFLGVLNVPYFAPSFHFVPAHDTMAYAQHFFFFYNEYVLHQEFPLWMPYNLYGSVADYNVLYTMSPALYFMMFIGRAFSADALFLFKIAFVLEQLILLVGVYKLAQRLFVQRTTILMVGIGFVATSFWASQLHWNFRIYYLIPLVLLFLIKFYDTCHFRHLLIAGTVGLLSLVGNVTYYAFFFLLLYGVLAVILLFLRRHQIGAHLHTLFTPLSLVWLVIFTLLAIVFSGYTKHALDYTISYSPDRDHLTQTVPFRNFLTYGPLITPQNLLELLYAVPAHRDLTFYIGLSGLVFFLYAVFKRLHDPVVQTICLTGLVVLFLSLGALTCVAYILYFFFPLFTYFRHLGLIRAPLKIFLLLLAGFGIDTLLNASQDEAAKQGLFFQIGLSLVGVILFLDIFAFKGGLPYQTYLEKVLEQHEQNFFFHYVSLFVVVILLGLLYWAIKSNRKHLPLILLGCWLFEMTSYHYFLLFVSPISLARRSFQQGVTVEESHRQMEWLESSLRVLPYHFQPARTSPTLTAQLITQTSPLLLASYGIKYSTLYSAAYVDPCFQEYRIDYLPVGIDRLMRARLGLPLDKPLIGGSPVPLAVGAPQVYGGPVENALSTDQIFLRAMGCQSPKLFLTSQVKIAHTLDETAALINASQDMDTVPVIFSETGQEIPVIPQTTLPAETIGTVQVTRFTANSLGVQAQVLSSGGAWLIYLDAYHPRWTATVNGKPWNIMTANLAFKAVYLEPGLNEVQLSFQGNGLSRFYIQILFYVGIFSVLLLLATVWYLSMPGLFKWLFQKRKHHREGIRL